MRSLLPPQQLLKQQLQWMLGPQQQQQLLPLVSLIVALPRGRRKQPHLWLATPQAVQQQQPQQQRGRQRRQLSQDVRWHHALVEWVQANPDGVDKQRQQRQQQQQHRGMRSEMQAQPWIPLQLLLQRKELLGCLQLCAAANTLVATEAQAMQQQQQQLKGGAVVHAPLLPLLLLPPPLLPLLLLLLLLQQPPRQQQHQRN